MAVEEGRNPRGHIYKENTYLFIGSTPQTSKGFTHTQKILVTVVIQSHLWFMPWERNKQGSGRETFLFPSWHWQNPSHLEKEQQQNNTLCIREDVKKWMLSTGLQLGSGQNHWHEHIYEVGKPWACLGLKLSRKSGSALV